MTQDTQVQREQEWRSITWDTDRMALAGLANADLMIKLLEELRRATWQESLLGSAGRMPPCSVTMEAGRTSRSQVQASPITTK